jgi:hypothetical protein
VSHSTKIERKLDRIAALLRLSSREYRARAIQIDRVWYLPVPSLGLVPLLGFEVEATPKSLKYLKGDLQNLRSIGCHGVVILCKENFGAEYPITRDKLKFLISELGVRVTVWPDAKLDQILDLLGG